jgi:hypothetical protein
MALAVVLGLVTIGFFAAGMDNAAVRSGLPCSLPCIWPPLPTQRSMRFHAEGRLDPTWPVIRRSSNLPFFSPAPAHPAGAGSASSAMVPVGV